MITLSKPHTNLLLLQLRWLLTVYWLLVNFVLQRWIIYYKTAKEYLEGLIEKNRNDYANEMNNLHRKLKVFIILNVKGAPDTPVCHIML